MNPADQEFPKPFGRYILERRIAYGGMAEIFLARQEGPADFSRALVIKRVLPHLLEDPAFVEMFLDEAKLAASLNHPNIVSIHDFGQVGNDYFLAMEIVRGPDLKRIHSACVALGWPFPYRLAAKIISSAAEALEYAHCLYEADGEHLQLIHRDVSPSNIVVSYDGATKLLDFGIAKASVSKHKTRSGFLKGKLAYMAPEQIEGHPLDPRADVYSLGVVLYEMVTGRPPFTEENDLKLMNAVLSEIPAPPRQYDPNIPDRLEALILSAIAKDPALRPPTARVMGGELERFILETGEPVSSFEISEWLRYLATHAKEPLDALKASGGSYGSSNSRSPVSSTDTQSPKLQDSQSSGSAGAPRSDVSGSVSQPVSDVAHERFVDAESLPVPVVQPKRTGLWISASIISGLALALVVFLLLDPISLFDSKDINDIAPTRGNGEHVEQRDDPAGQADLEAALDLQEKSHSISDGDGESEDLTADAVDEPEYDTGGAGGEIRHATDDDQAEELIGDSGLTALPIPRDSVGDRLQPREQPAKVAKAITKGRKESEPPAVRPAHVPRAASGFVDIRTNPWTEVTLGGRKLGYAPGDAIELPPGRHELALRNPEYGIDEMLVVDISSGGRERIIRDFSRGQLAFRVRPWGNVYVDNEMVGTAPMPPIELPVGTKQVFIVNPETKKSKRIEVQIRYNEVTTVRADLSE